MKPPEWKLMAIVARNAKFRECRFKFLPDLGQKWQKTDYF